jgi:hypothetical protein
MAALSRSLMVGPLSSDAWDAQMLSLGHSGYRVVAHDRRGHGRSGQSWHGNNMDQYADDLAELFEIGETPCAARLGQSLLVRSGFLIHARQRTRMMQEGVAGGNVPQKWVAENALRS